jgi:HAD superfamily hydrolase (TIGR01509 family)
MHLKKFCAKGIMFDLDGTILDTRPAYIEAARIAFKKLGQQIPGHQELLEIPKRLEQRQPISDIIQTETREFLDLYLRTFYRIASSKTKPLPRVTETLETLCTKAKMAVITMRFMPKDLIVKELKQYNLDKYFVHIVTALDTNLPKPSPEALTKAIEVMDVQMCDCVIVGDSVVDIKAGKIAGAKTVAVLSGLYSIEELINAEPDFIIADIGELSKLIG